MELYPTPPSTSRTPHLILWFSLGISLLAIITALSLYGRTYLRTQVVPTGTNSAPYITIISPTSAFVGDPAFVLNVSGFDFVPGSVVTFGTINKQTTFVSPTKITAAITASDLTTSGNYAVTVVGGASYNSRIFTINPRSIAPTITSISPASVFVGDPSFRLSVSGSNFVSGATVLINNLRRQTIFISSTQLATTIPVSDTTTAQTLIVAVVNPSGGGGGGGISNFLPLTVANRTQAPPTITSISPTSANEGDPGISLTINGTNFYSSSVVTFDYNTLPFSQYSNTQIIVLIPKSGLYFAGSKDVTVTNPSAGAVSNKVTFTVNTSPAPAITSISPTSVIMGNIALGGVTITVNGSGFKPDSYMRLGGKNPIETTYYSSTKLVGTLDRFDLDAGGVGSYTIDVKNLGGAPSNALTFTVSPNPVPTITSISPVSRAQGSGPFALTVTGTGFTDASEINFLGETIKPPGSTATTLRTLITNFIGPEDTPGTYDITVFNPTPGGGTSNAVTFTIN